MRPLPLLIVLSSLSIAVPLRGASAGGVLVDPDGAGDSTTIQGGISAAAIGDVVQVMAGTYAEDLDFQGKAIEVVSLDGPSTTAIVGTGAGPVVVFETGESSAAVLSGFDISGGDGTVGGSYRGGGVHVAGGSPTLENLVIHDCVSLLGGGIQLGESTSSLTDIELFDNTALEDPGGSWGYGGGLYAFNSDLVIDGLIAHDNTAVRGGAAMFGAGTTTMTGGSISDNDADRAGGLSFLDGIHTAASLDVVGNTATVSSGGVWASLAADLTLSGVTLTGNSAPDGGGLRVTEAVAALVNSVVTGNSCEGAGGGFRVDAAGSLLVDDSLLDGNTADFGGGGLVTGAGTLDVIGTRFSGNTADSSGGALYLGDSTSTVLAGTFDGNSSASDGGAIRVQAGTVTVTNSLFIDNAGSNGAGVHLFDGASGELRHLTMVGNSATSGGTVRVTTGSSLVLTDSIIAFPEDGSCVSAGDGAAWTIEYNDVFNPSGVEWSGVLTDPEGTDGNISENPGLVAYIADGVYDGDNLQLAVGSPCLDTADPAGDPDPDGSPPDMGAYGGSGASEWDAETDDDGDGWSVEDGDCADDDPDIHPAAAEECDGVDNDCDDDIDEGCGDDDDATAADDDDDDDDSSLDDDDDSSDDDDATGDDDDSALLVPDTSNCDCEGSIAAAERRTVGATAGLLLLSLICRRRRVHSRR